MKFVVELEENLCKGCELCVQSCKRNVLAMAPHINALGYRPSAVVDPERCTGCKACAHVCPDAVVTIYQNA